MLNRTRHRSSRTSVRRVAFAAATIAAALAVTACASSSGGTPSASGGETAASTKMTTAYLPITGFAPYTVGEELGIWADHNIDLDLVKVNSPADGLAAVVAGQMDVAQVNVGAIGAAIEQGIPIKIIAAGYWDEDTQGVYVAADSPIKDVSDLDGKTIGLGALNNNFQAVVNDALDEAGVDVASVNFTLIPIGDTAKTLLAGQLDAAQVAEPSLTAQGDALRAIIERPWDVLGAGEPHLVSYIITSEATYNQKKDELANWVAAWNESLEATQGNPDDTRAAVAAATGLATDITDVMRLPVWRTELDLVNAQKQLDLMVKFGMVPEAPKLEDYVATF